MDRVIYDEAASPALYRWRSFLRLLMSVHPRVGADEYALRIGAKQGLVPGWNAVHLAAGGEVPVRYIWIDPKGGRTTNVRPDVPDEEIHEVYEEDLPLFEQTSAWLQMKKLAEVLVAEQPQGVTPEAIRERMDALCVAAQAPLRGEDKEVNDRIGQALARIRNAVNGPSGTLDTFAAPVKEVVQDYLTFGITRRQASNIIAVLLAFFAIKFPSILDKTGGADTATKQVDHLIGLASKITSERHQYELGAFSQLTCLGLLWGETALIMAKQLAAHGAGPDLRRSFERKALYIDEQAVHELAPSLAHPISLAPFGVVEYTLAKTVGITNARGLYAGAGELGEGPLVPEDVWARVQRYSAASNRLETDCGPFGEFLSPALSEHLGAFLLAMNLGRSMR